jgi:aerobic carbon-monoxide dehydrogenase medium subunit
MPTRPQICRARLVALDATVMHQFAVGGTRSVSADETFFTGFWSSVLQPDEMITEFRIRPHRRTTLGLREVHHPISGLGDGGRGQRRRAGGSGRHVRHAAASRRRRAGARRRTGGHAGGTGSAHEGTDPSSDLRASAQYRAHLATVLTERVLLRCGYAP